MVTTKPTASTKRLARVPSKSAPQARLMAAVAHSPAVAAKVQIPQSVGKDFNQVDRGTQLLRQAMTAAALRGKG